MTTKALEIAFLAQLLHFTLLTEESFFIFIARTSLIHPGGFFVTFSAHSLAVWAAGSTGVDLMKGGI